ncbi:hypothetical protein AHAS_Ahas19G0258400 [Arachis hypogaea]
MLILMLQKLEFLSDLVVQPDVIVIFFWTLVILHYTLRKASLMSRGIIFILDFTYQDVILLPFLRNVALILGVAVWCGMAVLVNQNHGTAEHIAKTMETCNQPTPDSLHSKLAPWSRDLVVDGRILVWKVLLQTF